MTTRQAFVNFFVWVAVALGADVAIQLFYGPVLAAEFFGAWALEKALSLDNLFMFYFIFSAMRTPAEARPRVLKWGIVGVLLMRGGIILGGTHLLGLFRPLLYFFALFLLWAAVKLFFLEEETDVESEAGARQSRVELEQNWLVRLSTRWLDFDPHYTDSSFFVRRDGRWRPTTLLLVLVMIEGTDVPFAFDSLPAAMSVSQNFWVVLSSNLLAVMGLRAIYFVIENMQHRFSEMKYGIAILLAFASLKILLGDLGAIAHHTVGRVAPSMLGGLSREFGLHLPLGTSLAIIAGVIALTLAWTLVRTRRK